jgi:hypothetical protein
MAIRTSEAIAMAQPDVMLTVTGLPRAWKSALGVMQGLRRRMSRRRVEGKWAFHLETNPKSDGAHAHAWWRGTDLCIDLVRELAVMSGAGPELDITPAFAPPGPRIPALGYGLKSILAERPDTADAMWPVAADFLSLNGGVLVHASHGFWTDWHGRAIDGALERARVVAHGWRGELPVNDFLARWRLESTRWLTAPLVA